MVCRFLALKVHICVHEFFVSGRIDLAAGEIIYDVFQDDFMGSNLENQYVLNFTLRISFFLFEITGLAIVTEKNLSSLTEKKNWSQKFLFRTKMGLSNQMF